MPSFFHGRRAFLTYPRSTVVFDEYRQWLCSKYDVRWMRIAREKHADGTDHFHVAVEFSGTIRAGARSFDYLGRHPNVQSTRNWNAVKQYLEKDGDFVDWSPAEPLQIVGEFEAGEDDIFEIAAKCTRREFVQHCYNEKVHVGHVLYCRCRNGSQTRLGTMHTRRVQSVLKTQSKMCFLIECARLFDSLCENSVTDAVPFLSGQLAAESQAGQSMQHQNLFSGSSTLMSSGSSKPDFINQSCSMTFPSCIVQERSSLQSSTSTMNNRSTVVTELQQFQPEYQESLPATMDTSPSTCVTQQLPVEYEYSEWLNSLLSSD